MTDEATDDFAAAEPGTIPPGVPAGEPSTAPAPGPESPAGPVSDAGGAEGLSAKAPAEELAPGALVDALDQVLGDGGTDDDDDPAPPRKGRRTNRAKKRKGARRESVPKDPEAPAPVAVKPQAVAPAQPATEEPWTPIDEKQLADALKGANGLAQLMLAVLGFKEAYRFTFFDQEVERIAKPLTIALNFERVRLPQFLQRLMLWTQVGVAVGACIQTRIVDKDYGPKPNTSGAGQAVPGTRADGMRQELLDSRAA